MDIVNRQQAVSPLGIAQSEYVNVVLALNPLGYRRLDGNANDATRHGNNATLVNGMISRGVRRSMSAG